MKNQSTLKIFTQGNYKYIYIYYKSRGRIIRINTENVVNLTCMKKDLTYNSKMKNYEELNQKTLNLKSKVDEYIRLKIENGIIETISQNECKKFIEGKFSTLKEKRNVLQSFSLDDFFYDFYEFKKLELNNRPSYKDYLTLFNSLKDFQKFHSIVLTFEMINSYDFLVRYRNFLWTKRSNRYITVGGLNDNTVNKRISGLKTFLRWIENRGIYTFDKSIYNFKIPVYENSILVMEKDEIRTLIDLEIQNPTWRKLIDVFVFNCFVGLRYSDLIRLKKTDFYIDEDGDYILIKENQKTGFTVQVPITKTPLSILKKYDFRLPIYSEPYFNRKLKKIFEVYELFDEKVIRKRRVNKTIEDCICLKRELISSHTCRRTFVTLGISNNVPLNSLMLSTGHRKIQTLQKYMKKTLDKNSFKWIDF